MASPAKTSILDDIVGQKRRVAGSSDPAKINMPTSDLAIRRVRALGRLERIARAQSIEEGSGNIVFPTAKGLRYYGIFSGGKFKPNRRGTEEAQLDEATRAQANIIVDEPDLQQELEDLDLEGAWGSSGPIETMDRLSEDMFKGVKK